MEKVDIHAPMSLAFLENCVASELVQQLVSSEEVTEVYHFRSGDGKDVGCVLGQSDGRLSANEVKARDAVLEADFHGLTELHRQTDKDFICGIVLYRGQKIIHFGERLWAVSVDAMWM